ncbi:MAG: hypothetical protein KGR48_00810 [Alphaproteobacteria bacterium]|nr:hypothetical protein [Alphaproteobacteria bacterium]MDE2014255.1 hypothetical protein [Alphaproteobacteria bacterium]MDE2074228.1 hypothetical protein [Alphaproteobacteria bacterium]MDE2352240.1 hypothetical protein [Alphaproteobacteria bacterium]
MSADPRIDRLVIMAERLIEALSADIAALEKGRPREMKTLDPEIQTLSAQYTREAAQLAPAALQAAPAEARARLTAVTGRFQDVLALHGRLLTRIRGASEGIIKAVAEEVDRRRLRGRPYAPPGKSYGGPAPAPRPVSTGAMLYNHVV